MAARKLVLIPNPDRIISGATRIDPTYPRGYTPEQMRGWADDLERLYQTPPAEISKWRGTAPDQLTPEARRLLAVHDKFLVEADRGICGDLGSDGRVELSKGHHRAAYMLERGTDPIPVWVTCRDSQQLERFSNDCDSQLARKLEPTRKTAQRGESERELGRTALDGAGRDASPLPYYHAGPERLERTRDRGVWRPERDH